MQNSSIKKEIKIIILSLSIISLLSKTIFAGISIVYNFKIAQITRRPFVKHDNAHPYMLGGLLFNAYQKTYVGQFRENYTGGLTTVIYNFYKPYYIQADLAVSQINKTINHVYNFSAIEPDDFLITAGRNFILNKKLKDTISGLFGIPMHPVFTLQSVTFGSGQFGAGIQLDGLYKLTNKTDFLWGGRYNYFFPRNSKDILENNYKFTIGSISDLILAIQSRLSKAHGIEGGYASHWGFSSKSYPQIPDLSKMLTSHRNAFYFVYKYTLFTQRVTHRALLSISYGYDTKPKTEYGFANAINLWGSWGINF